MKTLQQLKQEYQDERKKVREKEDRYRAARQAMTKRLGRWGAIFAACNFFLISFALPGSWMFLPLPTVAG